MKPLFLLLLLSQVAFGAMPVPTVPQFNKVVWIWLENTPDSIMANERYILNLEYYYPSVRFTHMKAVSEVAQANVMAMISGSDYGIHDNEMVKMYAPTIINLLQAKGVSWKVYAEQYPGACYLSAGTGDYQRSRVPFLSLPAIQNDRFLCAKVVGFEFLYDEIKLGILPQLSIVIPSLSGSGATNGMVAAENTLRTIVDPIFLNADGLSQTTIIISTTTNNDINNPELLTMILGNGVSGYGLTNDQEYNHYHLLRTIEDGFNLGQLKQNDSKVDPMLGFWK